MSKHWSQAAQPWAPNQTLYCLLSYEFVSPPPLLWVKLPRDSFWHWAHNMWSIKLLLKAISTLHHLESVDGDQNIQDWWCPDTSSHCSLIPGTKSACPPHSTLSCAFYFIGMLLLCSLGCTVIYLGLVKLKKTFRPKVLAPCGCLTFWRGKKNTI